MVDPITQNVPQSRPSDYPSTLLLELMPRENRSSMLSRPLDEGTCLEGSETSSGSNG